MSDALEAAQLIERLGRLVRAAERGGELSSMEWDALRFLGRANRFSRMPEALADWLLAGRDVAIQTLILLETKGHIAQAAIEGGAPIALTARGRQALAADPLGTLATDIAGATDVPALSGQLGRVLTQAIQRNRGKAFGLCRECRFFERDATPGVHPPHRCGALGEGLSDEDSGHMCVEQQPRA